MLVSVWLIYQPGLPAVPEVENERSGAVASTLRVLEVVVILPATSSDLKSTVITPSGKAALFCHAHPFTDTCALAKPDPESEPFADALAEVLTIQPFKPSTGGIAGSRVGAIVSTFTSSVSVDTFPARS